MVTVLYLLWSNLHEICGSIIWVDIIPWFCLAWLVRLGTANAADSLLAPASAKSCSISVASAHITAASMISRLAPANGWIIGRWDHVSQMYLTDRVLTLDLP